MSLELESCHFLCVLMQQKWLSFSAILLIMGSCNWSRVSRNLSSLFIIIWNTYSINPCCLNLSLCKDSCIYVYVYINFIYIIIQVFMYIRTCTHAIFTHIRYLRSMGSWQHSSEMLGISEIPFSIVFLGSALNIVWRCMIRIAFRYFALASHPSPAHDGKSQQRTSAQM